MRLPIPKRALVPAPAGNPGDVDAADYPSTFDDFAAYHEAVIDEGDDDPALIARALGAIARSGTVSELARRAGMSREGLYKALSADGNPRLATIIKVSRALGLRLHFESIA
jgi:probable addiction module antidote protein